jgi:hypothetical protein
VPRFIFLFLFCLFFISFLLDNCLGHFCTFVKCESWPQYYNAILLVTKNLFGQSRILFEFDMIINGLNNSVLVLFHVVGVI